MSCINPSSSRLDVLILYLFESCIIHLHSVLYACHVLIVAFSLTIISILRQHVFVYQVWLLVETVGTISIPTSCAYHYCLSWRRSLPLGTACRTFERQASHPTLFWPSAHSPNARRNHVLVQLASCYCIMVPMSSHRDRHCSLALD
jgi:hypothetical protein